jgi:hypothetical protein
LYGHARPALTLRGASRSSRTLARDAMDAGGSARRALPARTAKACGPGAPTLASSPARRFAGRRGLSSPAPRGERAISRNTVAQGMPDCFGVPVVTAACFPCCRRAMGAASIRHSLRPPRFEGDEWCITWAFGVAGMRRCDRNLRAAHPSRRRFAAPQDEVEQVVLKSDHHGEERGNAVRLEPCGPDARMEARWMLSA